MSTELHYAAQKRILSDFMYYTEYSDELLTALKSEKGTDIFKILIAVFNTIEKEVSKVKTMYICTMENGDEDYMLASNQNEARAMMVEVLLNENPIELICIMSVTDTGKTEKEFYA